MIVNIPGRPAASCASSGVEVRTNQLEHSSVSHSATESDILSSDAGLRVDGIPALDLWDLVTEVPQRQKYVIRGETKNESNTCGGSVGPCNSSVTLHCARKLDAKIV